MCIYCTVYSPATTVASSNTRLFIWTGLCVYTVYCIVYIVRQQLLPAATLGFSYGPDYVYILYIVRQQLLPAAALGFTYGQDYVYILYIVGQQLLPAAALGFSYGQHS